MRLLSGWCFDYNVSTFSLSVHLDVRSIIDCGCALFKIVFFGSSCIMIPEFSKRRPQHMWFMTSAVSGGSLLAVLGSVVVIVAVILAIVIGKKRRKK